MPNLAGKQDLIPAAERRTWLRADRPGVYRGQCAEFCGLQHAHMAFVVIAEPPADFERWRERAARAGAAAGDADRRRGGQRCSDQPVRDVPHDPRHAAPAAASGPTSRTSRAAARIAAGTLPNTRGNLAAWIVDPQRIKPGNNMPAMPPRARTSSHALLAYLESAAMSDGRGPATTTELPDGDAPTRDAGADVGHRPGFIGWLSTVDHKSIGRRYIVTAFVFFALGGAAGAAHARCSSRAPENELVGAGPLQPALHHARHDDDVPVRRAGDGGASRSTSCR